jgi:GMP synthase-like glutamine amidotransferase
MAPLEARTVDSSQRPKVRMLVLETDEPHADTQEEKGSFGQVLHDLLERAGDEHNPELGIDTVMQYVVEPDGGAIPKTEEITDDIHAILITGSVYDAHSDEEWIHKLMEYIKRTYETTCERIEAPLT